MPKKTRKDGKSNGSGKKLQKYLKLSHDLELQRRGTESPLDMNISIWYNKDVNRWRWTLVGDIDERRMESGDAEELEVALSDVRRTIEWIMETQEE